jgi:KipI family sensor histidine kinase inhibitor
MSRGIRCTPLGDQALTLVLGSSSSPALHSRIVAITRRLREHPVDGVTDVVPAYTTIALWYDPARRSFESLADQVQALAEAVPSPADEPRGREWTVPVRYDGPDLEEVARRTGLTREEVIHRHTGRIYRVYLLGFVPGFAFLGDLDPSLVLPRRSEPRRRVPAGSVAIAAAQTGIYPLETPGGWHLIGRTELKLFDPAWRSPALFAPGDRVRFEPVT